MLTILCAAGACQTTDVLPTPQAVFASPTARPALQAAPTQRPRAIFAATDVPQAESATRAAPLLATQPDLIQPPTLGIIAADSSLSDPDEQIIGYSVDGRAITAREFGSGSRVLLLIAGIHGGWEANTVELARRLIDHFEAAPSDVLAGIRLIIIPVANPDGLAYGQTPRGRFNGNGVDLNRNWSCDWSSDAYWRRERVNAGLRALSEPETNALTSFILARRPAAMLSYHSAANGVFPGNCRGDHGSLAMASIYAEASGYGCCEAFSAYPVSGTAVEWADGEGIPSADVELQSSDSPEFERNLRAIMALQVWILERPE